jgi:glycosyltransferase involved in cell wall biosynthesis
MAGVFRHAEALSRLYWPAYVTELSEPDFKPETLQRLSDYLGKKVLHLTPEQLVRNQEGIRVWVSPALDHNAPWLEEQHSFTKVTIIHDAFALSGEYGDAGKIRAFRGIAANDAFAYVSTWALHRAMSYYSRARKGEMAEFLRYGCFHSLETLPSAGSSFPRESDFALSVGTVSPRKNLHGMRVLTHRMGYRHTHVGQVEEIDATRLDDLVIHFDTHLLGQASDSILRRLFHKANLFICGSLDEGFSMPPMEAVLHGVPHVLLSDIPAHREFYNDYATFYDLVNPEPPAFLYTVSEEKRCRMFEERKFSVVAKNLTDFIATVAI